MRGAIGPDSQSGDTIQHFPLHQIVQQGFQKSNWVPCLACCLILFHKIVDASTFLRSFLAGVALGSVYVCSMHINVSNRLTSFGDLLDEERMDLCMRMHSECQLRCELSCMHEFTAMINSVCRIPLHRRRLVQ